MLFHCHLKRNFVFEVFYHTYTTMPNYSYVYHRNVILLTLRLKWVEEKLFLLVHFSFFMTRPSFEYEYWTTVNCKKDNCEKYVWSRNTKKWEQQQRAQLTTLRYLKPILQVHYKLSCLILTNYHWKQHMAQLTSLGHLKIVLVMRIIHIINGF